MGDGNAGVRRGGNAGGDRWNHLEGDARVAQDLGLLTAAAEHEGVTALQAHDDVRRPAVLDEQPVGLGLGDLLAAALLADEDEPCVAAGAVERAGRDQAVVDHHVGPGNQVE